jgi:mannose-6-phosphate isomerase-like protein (cupin superfamily)
MDAPVTTWTERPGGSIVMDVWRAEHLPTHVDQDRPLSGGEVQAPPPEGVVVRVSSIPPDSVVDAKAYAAAMRATYGEAAASAADEPGMHRTDTVDVVTVVSGELVAVMESGEAVLRPGDSIVQRGTKHAWKNRTDAPVTLVSVMMSARR